jgi:hypothetical protein
MSEDRRDELAGSGLAMRGNGPPVGGDGDGAGCRPESPTRDSAVKGLAVRLLGRRPGQVFKHVPSWGKRDRQPGQGHTVARDQGGVRARTRAAVVPMPG